MKMDSFTNGENTVFTEKELLNATYHHPLENTTVATNALQVKIEEEDDGSKSIKMSRIQHFCFAVLLLALFTITIVTASGTPLFGSAESRELQDLLANVEPAALHDVLHKELKDKFQHGVYPEDRTAVEMVHKQNAQAASSLIELAKRQAGGGSNGTITNTSTSTSTLSDVTVTISETISESVSSQTSTSTSPSALTTSSQDTASASETTPESSSPSVTPIETTSPASSSEPSRSSPSITQSVTYTTILADGGGTTITSVTLVNADQAASQGGGGGTSTDTSDVSLQSGGARQLGLSPCVGIVGLVAAWAF